MSVQGIAEFLRHYAEVRAHLPYLPDVHVTDDLGADASTADARRATIMVFGTEPDGRVRVRIAPDSIPGRAITWHEAAHVAQLVVSSRLVAQPEHQWTDVVGQMVRAAFAARGVAIGSAPAYEQMASMLPECFIGEWGGYAHPLWGFDPRVVAPNVREWHATAAAEAMRRWWLSLMEWRPTPFVWPNLPLAPVAPVTPEPAPTMLFDDPVGHLRGLRVTRGFGDRSLPAFGIHDGLDLAPQVAGQSGVPLYAIAGGTVVIDDDDARYVPADDRTWGGVGVVVRQDDGVEVGFWHMEPPNLVTHGQRVRAGQLLGYIGRTGAAFGVHVHVGVKRGGNWIDPLAYLEEEADMAFTEEDRARLKRIEEKQDRLLTFVGRVLPSIWLQRLFYGLNPWTGRSKTAAEQAPAYTAPPPGWQDPAASGG